MEYERDRPTGTMQKNGTLEKIIMCGIRVYLARCVGGAQTAVLPVHVRFLALTFAFWDRLT